MCECPKERKFATRCGKGGKGEGVRGKIYNKTSVFENMTRAIGVGVG